MVPLLLFNRVRGLILGRVVILASSVAFSAILSLAVLPFTTIVLDAADYGTYAILISLVMVCSAAIDGGAGIILPAMYGQASLEVRGQLFGSSAIVVFIFASIVGLIGYIIWLKAPHLVPATHLAVAVAAIMVPIRALTILATIAFSVLGRGNSIALQNVFHAVGVFVITLLALFVFHLGADSLMIGAAAGQTAALLTCIAIRAASGEMTSPTAKGVLRALNQGRFTIASGITNSLWVLAENLSISVASGVHAAGIMGHARTYYNFLMSLSSAVTHNVFAISLAEARNKDSFAVTTLAWSAVQLAFGCAGICAALVGKELISLLTNGKFAEAAIYVPFLFIVAIINTMEQRSFAIVYSSHAARTFALVRSISICLAAILLYPAALAFGISGIVAVCLVDAIVGRAIIHVLANQNRGMPWSDWEAMVSVLAIIAAAAAAFAADISLQVRIALIPLFIGALAFAGRNSLRKLIIWSLRPDSKW